jgi:cytochrome oxidase Cu insertion factor (SCO1/SenC/PrrC family)
MKTILTIFVTISALIILMGCSTARLTPTVPTEPIAETPAETQALDLNWFDMELKDVRTGESFTMNDFAGKVVLLETMAIWCPNCAVQANEIRKLKKALGDPEDLVTVSLDVDFNEDEASLKEYVEGYGFDWRYAVAPLEVARALGNLYSAEYLNPPLSPMLIIDRKGEVRLLDFGKKDAETLQKILEPFLAN